MAAYTDFTDDILAEVTGAPYPLVLRTLRRTVRDFCKRTYTYQADLTDLSVVSGTQTYTLSDPANTEIIALTRVQKASTSDTRTIKPPFDEYTFDPPTFTLDVEPTDSYDLEIRVALRPDQSSTTVDDIIYDNYYDGIIAGTCSRLLRTSRAPWFDMELANIYFKEYGGYVTKARIDLAKQFTTRNTSITARSWV